MTSVPLSPKHTHTAHCATRIPRNGAGALPRHELPGIQPGVPPTLPFSRIHPPCPPTTTTAHLSPSTLPRTVWCTCGSPCDSCHPKRPDRSPVAEQKKTREDVREACEYEAWCTRVWPSLWQPFFATQVPLTSTTNVLAMHANVPKREWITCSMAHYWFDLSGLCQKLDQADITGRFRAHSQRPHSCQHSHPTFIVVSLRTGINQRVVSDEIRLNLSS